MTDVIVTPELTVWLTYFFTVNCYLSRADMKFDIVDHLYEKHFAFFKVSSIDVHIYSEPKPWHIGKQRRSI